MYKLTYDYQDCYYSLYLWGVYIVKTINNLLQANDYEVIGGLAITEVIESLDI